MKRIKRINYSEHDLFSSKESSRIILLPTDQIIPNKNQPREVFDEEKIITLADSIRQYGIISPLLVNASPVKLITPGGEGCILKYRLIAGERRLRAAKLIDLERVPCILVKDISEAKQNELAIIENIQREDLDYFEQAHAIESLIRLENLTQEQAAEKLSMSQSAIANKLRLLKLSPAEQCFIRANRLTERHARAFVRISDASLRSLVIHETARKGLKVSETESYIEALCFTALKTDGPKPDTAVTAVKKDTEKKKKRSIIRKFLTKDVRLFTNTLERAVETIRSAGFFADIEKKEEPESYIYSIKVSKKAS